MSIGGGKSSGSQSDPAASTLARIAERFATETGGLRKGLISQLSSILTNPSGKGGFDQAGYDAAVTQYQRGLAAYNASAAQNQNAPAAAAPWLKGRVTTSTAPPPTAPNREDFQMGGGVQVPIIAQAVEATQRASSEAQKGTQEELARTNLVGTPFGQNILATGRREGNLAAANTQTDIMKTLYNLVPNFVLGQSQNALSGLSGAVGGNVSGKGKGFGAGASK